MIIHNWHNSTSRRSKHSHRNRVSVRALGKSWPSDRKDLTLVSVTFYDEDTLDQDQVQTLDLTMTMEEAKDLHNRLGKMLADKDGA